MLTVALTLFGLVADAMATGVASRPDTARANAGRAVYNQHCAVCHGVQGEGAPGWERPDARGELPAPPHDARGHTWKHSDAMLYRIIQQGWRDAFNKTGHLTMPAFKGLLSHADTMAAITYLKTMWTPEQRRFQAEETRRQPLPPKPP